MSDTHTPAEHVSLVDTVSWSPRGDVHVVKISGELDLGTASDIGEHLSASAGSAVSHLVLDLTDVQFMSLHGLRMILSARNALRGSGRLYLVGVADNPPVRRAVEITEMGTELAGYADLAELLRALDNG